MGIDVYITVGALCGTVLYLLRRRGPLGHVLLALAETLHHRNAHERRVFESLSESAREERTTIKTGLDAYEHRSARQDRDLRNLAGRVGKIETRLGLGDGGGDA